jgi:hypothetical protein
MHTEACAYAIKSAQRKLQPLCLSPFTPPDCNHVLWSHFAFIAICLAQAEDEEKEKNNLAPNQSSNRKISQRKITLIRGRRQS